MIDFILASRSPRRTELLQSAGFPHRIFVAPCDERFLAPESPLAYVERVARAKAQASAQLWLDQQSQPATALILAADTTVWHDGQIEPFGKPENRNQARDFLRDLTTRGQHNVSTAYVLMRVDSQLSHFEIVRCETCTTAVWMRSITPFALEAHLDRNEWSDKAGGYAIQGAAAALITRIDGSYTNVVGLPLAQVCAALAELGIEPRT